MADGTQRSSSTSSAAEGLWDQKVSAETVVSVYRNPNAQTHSQTLVASRRSSAPQTFDFPTRSHTCRRACDQTDTWREKKKKGSK